MRPVVSPILSWTFDPQGRPEVIIEKRGWGYRVSLARRLGGQSASARDPEEAEMLAAQLVRRRRGA